MEAVLYIDIVFFVTWGVDTFLLWAAGRLTGLRAKKWRLALGGLLSAAAYCLWLCFFRKNGGLLLSFLLLLIGVAAAYAPKRSKLLLELMGASLLLSFLLGGGMLLLLRMTQMQQFFGRGMILQQVCPWWLPIWSILAAYLLLKGGARWLESHIQRRKEYCMAEVHWRGKTAEGYALIDTGNGLRQGDGRGVVVLEIAALLPLFSPEESVALLSGAREGLEHLPFTSLGNPDGRLWGIRADELLLCFGEKQIRHRAIFVGITFDAFTGAYEGLVPPCLLKEGSE